MGNRKKSTWLVCVGLLLGVGVATTRAGLGDGLVSYFKLDDGSGTVATDSSGNGHDGTLFGSAVAWIPGHFGGGLFFATEEAEAGVQFPTTGMSVSAGTISLWGYLSEPQAARTRYFFGHTTRPPYGSRIQIYMNSGVNTLSLGLGDTHARKVDIVPLATKTWHHVVLTWDNGKYVVYANGEKAAEGTYTGLTALDPVATISDDDNPDEHEAFDGILDEARIYSRAITAAEVKEIFQVPPTPQIKAWGPTPADGAMAVVAPTLAWKSLDIIPFHNVYVGTDPNLTAADLIGLHVPVNMYFYLPGPKPGVTYYWRVDEVESDGVTVHTGDMWTFTAQAMTAYAPNPADGANDASPTPTLTWQVGQDAVKHHVYFGTSQEAVTKGDKTTDKGIVDQPLFKSGDLQEAKTYYWRVDEILASGEVRTGPVWSFRTYVRVDDFESYTDDEGSRIYETWVDGVTNGTGAQVGYWDAPFAEQKIVHGGKQSMPFEYNNVKTPYYSEAEQEFPAAEGGGNYDIDTLVLWVHGQTTNSQDTLYVALKDTHGQIGVVSHPDPTVVTQNKWIEWRIFMPEFMMTGVDLMSVKKIMIGVGDRENPAPDGAGRIFLDDIHAIKTMTFDPSQMMMP
ncbi:MAG: LamG domain-containing protein [Phycisphaerae bacterium]|nr:LamG domain-containing protein [Phycisphaerae bacterium]